MKKCKKLIAAFMMTMSILVLWMVPVLAATSTQDGLVVTLSTDKVNYEKGEKIGTSISVTNQNSYALNGVDIESLIPDGYKLMDGDVSKKHVESLSAGETVELKVTYCPQNNGKIIDDNLDKAKPGANDTPATKDVSTKKGKIKSTNTPKSGDNMLIGLWVVLAVLGFVILIGVQKKKKQINLMALMLIGVTTFTSLPIGISTIKAEETNSEISEIVVNDSVNVGDKKVKISSSIKYKKLSNSSEGKKTYTRAEWIDILVDEFGYPVNKKDASVEYSYTDIEDSVYADEIQTAKDYCLLEADESEFKPDEPATREFMAFTVINSLGYTQDNTIECNDKEELKYVSHDANAVELGIVLLENNYFYPARAISENEVNNTLQILESINSSLDVPDKNIIKYKDNIKTTNKSNVISDENNILIIKTSAVENIDVGSIIVIDDKKAYKIISYENNNDDTTTITYSEPDLNEFLDSVDMAGTLVPDFSKFVPAEGMDVNVTTSDEDIACYGLLDFDDTTIDTGAKVHLDGTIPEKFLGNAGKKIDINYSLDVGIPSVSYASDVDFHGIVPYVKNAYFKIKQDTSAGVEVSTKNPGENHPIINDMVDTYIPLGQVPLIGTNAVGAVLEVDLRFSVTGKVTVEYNVSGDIGCQVYHNKPRNISALQTSASVGIEAEGKVGPELEGALELFNKKLICFSAGAGAKISGSIKVRTTGMVCVDGSVGTYVEMDAFKDSLVEDWLDISIHWDIIDKTLFSAHWENATKVDKCTYEENGTIKGAVAEAGNRSKTISGAKIEVLNNTTFEVENTTYTDNKGNYTISVDGGTHLLRISADGYIAFESFETVENKQSIYVETYLMVEGSSDPNAKGTISGKIINAVTGAGIGDSKLSIRKGWNNVSDSIISTISTDDNGLYTVELPLGNYTILCEKAGYITNHINVAVMSGIHDGNNLTMNPNDGTENIPAGQIRIVLTWGKNPMDLDSHLIYKGEENQNYHIYYANKDTYDENDEKLSDLDRDDTTSYGPETLTIYKKAENGTYSYYVRDYSNGSDLFDKEMTISGAKVQVYVGDTLLTSYNMPSDAVGNVWHVFDIDATTNTITVVNHVYGSYSNSLKADGEN